MSHARQNAEAADRDMLAAMQRLVDGRGLFCEPHLRHAAFETARRWAGMQAKLMVEDRLAARAPRTSAPSPESAA